MSEILIRQQQYVVTQLVGSILMVSETPGGRFADALNLLEQIAAEVIARTQPTQAEGDIETLAKFAAAVAERLASLRRAMAQPLVS